MRSERLAESADRAEGAPSEAATPTTPPRRAEGEAPSGSADDGLEVSITDGRLVISVGANILVNALGSDYIQPPYKIVDPAQAVKEIVRELKREEEDGTTVVHKMLDQAALDAWENGGEGFRERNDDD